MSNDSNTSLQQDERVIADAITGALVSVDISTGDHDADARIFGRVIEVMTVAGGSSELTLVVEPEARAALAQPACENTPDVEPAVTSSWPTVNMSAAGMRVIQGIEENRFHKYAGGIANSVFDAMIKAAPRPPQDVQAAVVEALKASITGLDDWLNIYAEEHCNPERVREAKNRVREFGTIGYIAHLQQANRAALALITETEQVKK